MKLDGATATTQYYGYINNSANVGAMVPVLGNVTTPALPSEASKTEPDKNVYLVLKGQKGADANYNYGTHFLYQGHEAGAHGYITRINLDADVTHRVTLLADTLADGIHVSNGDASVAGLLGAQNPTPFSNGWRVFWTQQHADNNTWEIVPKK